MAFSSQHLRRNTPRMFQFFRLFAIFLVFFHFSSLFKSLAERTPKWRLSSRKWTPIDELPFGECLFSFSALENKSRPRHFLFTNRWDRSIENDSCWEFSCGLVAWWAVCCELRWWACPACSANAGPWPSRRFSEKNVFFEKNKRWKRFQKKKIRLSLLVLSE